MAQLKPLTNCMGEVFSIQNVPPRDPERWNYFQITFHCLGDVHSDNTERYDPSNMQFVSMGARYAQHNSLAMLIFSEVDFSKNRAGMLLSGMEENSVRTNQWSLICPSTKLMILKNNRKNSGHTWRVAHWIEEMLYDTQMINWYRGQYCWLSWENYHSPNIKTPMLCSDVYEHVSEKVIVIFLFITQHYNEMSVGEANKWMNK